MANKDTPKGATPVGEARSNKYTAGSACRPGDLVRLNSDGKIDPAAASQSLIGVCAELANADGDVVMVWDDPDQKFVIQADSTDIDTQTDIGLNYNFLATAANTTYNISRMELDSDTGDAAATAAVLPLKLLGIQTRADNAIGTNTDCIVKINNHQLSAGTGTAGV